MLEINFNPFPLLSTPRLVLRQISHEDTDELFLLRSDEQLMKYLGQPLAQSKEEITLLIEKLGLSLINNESIAWGITLKDQPRLIGVVAYRKFIKEHYRGEAGYTLLTAHWGKGIMDEALKAIISYGFTTLGLHSIEANVDKENIASIKLLEKNGFIKEAHFKESYFFEGRFIDSVIYSLLSPR